MSAEKIPPSKRPLGSAADAAQRLATIVDAAERAAESVIDDAEARAKQHLDEALARADRMVAERLRELADQLDPRPARGDRPTPHLKPVAEAPPATAEESVVEVEADEGEPLTPRRPGSAGARLLATQMAVSGASREEIGARLRNGFDIDDTDEILDAILGPEG